MVTHIASRAVLHPMKEPLSARPVAVSILPESDHQLFSYQSGDSNLLDSLAHSRSVGNP
jgi:hypothetical protein